MRDLVRRYDALPSGWRIVASAVTQALPFYGAALLGQQVTDVAQKAGLPGLLVHGATLVVVFTVILAVRGYAAAARREREAGARVRRSAVDRAHTIVDRIVSMSLSDMTTGTPEEQVSCFSSVERLQRLVHGVYEVLEGAFSGDSSDERINFESTFITKSYKDGFLTIGAYANRDGRAPQSLILRQQNPSIYEQTVAALVYREASPSVRIIPDTEQAQGYNALYEGQKKRVKSTLIYPVRDGANVLLGTLVLHCEVDPIFQTKMGES